MIHRISRQKENVTTLSNLITQNTYSEYIDFEHIDNLLSWLALENFLKRKGMTLFAWLETPLFSLIVLSVGSVGSLIFIYVKRFVLENGNSLTHDSALATWFYLALLSLFHVARLLYYGHKFHRETIKQDYGMDL